MILRRDRRNPILKPADLPPVPPRIIDPSAVFNPGAVREEESVRLMLRVQTRGRETYFLMAASEDGVLFTVRPQIVEFTGLETVRERIFHLYDPRLTRIEETIYAMVAMDLESGCRLGLARTEDCRAFEFLGIVSDEESRNGVLFPQRVGGRYLRLERPNRAALPGGGRSGDEILLAESSDLLHWQPVATVARGRPHYWDELIGPGPPPILTSDGWLCIYHGVALHLTSAHIYQAGVFLLDRDDPRRLLGRSPENILEPREPYEQVGQVPNVVFPSGAIVTDVDADGCADPQAELLVYYGAADTCVGLARTTVAELLAACGPTG